MDKYDLVLDIIEHPDKYSDAQISELLSDTECKELYNLLCKTSATMKIMNGKRSPDIDEEWEKIKVRVRHVWCFNFLSPGSRAASIVILSLTSIAALALGVAVVVSESSTAKTDSERDQTTIVNSADIITADSNDTVITLQEDIPTETLLYKDVPLEKILEDIAESHNLTVDYRNKETAKLHLYYKLNPALPLTEVIDQLNTFEQINIHLNDNTLIVD